MKQIKTKTKKTRFSKRPGDVHAFGEAYLLMGCLIEKGLFRIHSNWRILSQSPFSISLASRLRRSLSLGSRAFPVLSALTQSTCGKSIIGCSVSIAKKQHE